MLVHVYECFILAHNDDVGLCLVASWGVAFDILQYEYFSYSIAAAYVIVMKAVIQQNFGKNLSIRLLYHTFKNETRDQAHLFV